MDEKKIARINELYHKSKAEGLTEAERIQAESAKPAEQHFHPGGGRQYYRPGKEIREQKWKPKSKLENG